MLRFSFLVITFFLFKILLFSANDFKKLSSENAKIIIDFALFNYDNIICEYYGAEKSYVNQLALLIHRYTGHDINQVEQMLLSDSLATKEIPIFYLKALNQQTRQLTGYYFIDD